MRGSRYKQIVYAFLTGCLMYLLIKPTLLPNGIFSEQDVVHGQEGTDYLEDPESLEDPVVEGLEPHAEHGGLKPRDVHEDLGPRDVYAEARQHVGQLDVDLPAGVHRSHQHNNTKILLMSYYRGGSTFVAELFNNNPDVFYWYEPLSALLETYRSEMKGRNQIIRDDVFYYQNGERRYLPDKYVQSMSNVLIDILNCNLEHVDRRVLEHQFAIKWGKSISMQPYRTCMQQYMPKKDDNMLKLCLSILQSKCRSAKVVMIKVLRINLDGLRKFILPQVDDVTTVYYTRDPRGMMTSRKGTPHGKVYDAWMEGIRNVCDRMADDLRQMKKIPRLVGPIRYEDLATSPIPTAQKLYKQLNLNMPNSLNDWIKENTNATEDNGSMGTARQNSTYVAYKWRSRLSEQIQLKTTELCGDVLKELEYN